MANFAYQVTNFAYQGAGLFAYQGEEDSQDQAPAVRNFSLREWRKWHHPHDEKRLRELRITPAVAEIIAEVAERQAERLDLDEQQRLEELTRKLELKGLQWQERYLELLNTQRQQLIDEEIASLMQEKQAAIQRREEEAILLFLMSI